MEHIGKYRVLKELGRGGFGAVFLGEDTRLGELVAIKMFKIRDENLANQVTSAAEDAGEILKQRFLNEAKTLRQLSRNPFIVEMYDFDELPDGTPYYVMPYLPHSLKDELGSDSTNAAVVAELDEEDRPRRLPTAKGIHYLEQLLIALKDVHNADLIHRDIKPANCLLNERQELRLCDFGIAKLPDSEHSESGIGMGSRNYMAPEQRQSAKHVDASSDVYSVGVLAYRMLTGTLPEGRYADPKAYQPGLSDELNHLILRALEQDKNKRFENAGDMLNALRAVNRNAGRHEEETEATSTWVGGDTHIKAELKPLQDKIAQLFLIQGEILSGDLPILRALGDLANLNDEDIRVLIDQTSEQLAQENSQQSAFQLWVKKLNQRADGQNFLTKNERKTLIDAATVITGRDKAQLDALLNHKFPDQQKGSSSFSDNAELADKVKTDEHHEQASSSETTTGKISHNKRRKITIGIAAIIVIGGLLGVIDHQMKAGKRAQYEAARLERTIQNNERSVEREKREQKEDWLNAKSENTYSSFMKYITKWPDGAHITDAREARNNIVQTLIKQTPEKIVSSLKSIPGGSFEMGCSQGDPVCFDSEKPRHVVNINAFKLMDSEVTYDMWDACFLAGGCSHNAVAKRGRRGQHPVHDVSFEDITREFIPWLNKASGMSFRLPTEGEWEYAARAGSTSRYSWGDTINCSAARYGMRSDGGECSSIEEGPLKVKSHKPNAYALYDMHGNLYEWTADCVVKNYNAASGNGAAVATGDCTRRVVRGGAWASDSKHLRSSFRDWEVLTTRTLTYGFRLAHD